MKTWARLQAGDIVDLVAPGFAFNREELRQAVTLLKSWGLVPRVPKNILGRDLLCAQSDAIRFGQLKQALMAKDSKVVWGVRGGYGAIRLLPNLQKLKSPKQAKLFVGLSDLTSLHVFLNQEWNWATWHGPHANYIARQVMDDKYVEEIRQMLFGEKTEMRFTGLKPMNLAGQRLVRSGGKVQAAVSGGNMVTLQSTLGTPFEWRPKGQIAFLEELGERAYRIDRILTHFEQAGTWQGVRGLVFGDFVGGQEPDGRNLVWKTLQRWALEQSFPVFKGVPSGHAEIQRVVPLGPRACLDGAQRALILPTGLRSL